MSSNDNTAQNAQQATTKNPLLDQFNLLEKGIHRSHAAMQSNKAQTPEEQTAEINALVGPALSILYAYVLATVRIASALEDTAELQKQIVAAQYAAAQGAAGNKEPAQG